MCIVLHKPAGKRLDRQTFENCFDANDDGAGFAIAENGKLHVEKGFFTLEDFLKAFEPHADKEAVVHFRIGTSAKKDVFNCHPWVVKDCHKGYEFAVAHNGILPYPHSDTKSDTGHFVDEVLGAQLRRDPWFLDNHAGRYLVEKYMGTFNKIVVLRSDGAVYILNREQGIEHEGTWYSNGGFRTGRYIGFGRSNTAGAVSGYDFFSKKNEYPSYYHDENDDAGVDRPIYPKQETIVEPKPVAPRGGISLLPHLTRDERMQMRKLGQMLCGHRRISWEDTIDAVRDAYIDHHPDKANLPVHILDREITKLSIRHADAIFS